MRALVFTLLLIIIALICCLFRFWRTFDKFRRITLSNTETLVEGLKTHKKSISEIDKQITEEKAQIDLLNQKFDKLEKALDEKSKDKKLNELLNNIKKSLK